MVLKDVLARGVAQIGKNPESGFLEHLFPTLAQARDGLVTPPCCPCPWALGLETPYLQEPWDTEVET